MEDNASDSSSSMERLSASTPSTPSTPIASESEESEDFFSDSSGDIYVSFFSDATQSSDDHDVLSDFSSHSDLEEEDRYISEPPRLTRGDGPSGCLPPNPYGPVIVPTRNMVRDFIDLQLGRGLDILRRPLSKSKFLVDMLTPTFKFEGHDGCVNCIHFSSDGSLLASGSDDLKVCVWDWARRKKLFSFDTGHSSNVFQSKFLRMEGNPCLVTTSRDGQVRLAELSSSGGCRSTRLLGKHDRACHKIALIHSNPKTFLTAGEDGKVLVFDVRLSDSRVQKIQASNSSLFGIHSNPVDENLYVVCGMGGLVTVHDLRATHGSASVENYGSIGINFRAVTCCMFNHNGTEILASYNNNLILAYHKSGQIVREHHGHRNEDTVKGISYFGSMSEYVISGSDCGNVFFWTGPNFLPFNKISGDDTGAVNCIEPHPNLPIMATSGLDSDVKIWFPDRDGDPLIQYEENET